MSINTTDLLQLLNSWLVPEQFKDYCHNGIQVSNSGRECLHLASAVTASKAAIDAAAEVNADVLLVHHGLFWQGDEFSINGLNYHRVKALMQNDIALLAYHLPLDEHLIHGNNVLLGRELGISSEQQHNLGLMQPSLGRYARHKFLADDLFGQLTNIMQRTPQHFAFGPAEIDCLAWCTGAAQDGILEAYKAGAKAYISGEVSERTFHSAKELGMHYFAVGHHASERFGVKSLAKAIAKNFAIKQTYIEIYNPV